MYAFQATERSPKTVQNTGTALRFFLEHTALIAIEDWLDIRMVQDVFFSLKNNRSWSPATYNSYRKDVSSYFLFLENMGYIDTNPINKLMKVAELIKNQPSISDKDIQKIIRYLEDNPHGINQMQHYRDRLFVTLLAHTGGRPKELLGLKLSSFSPSRDEITIHTSK